METQKKKSGNYIFIVSMIMLLFYVGKSEVFAQNEQESPVTVSSQDDESAAKAAVEEFLVALGNSDHEKVRTMFLPNANIASISIKDGESNIYTATAEEYITQREEKQNRKFKEPVREFTVNFSQGILAFVRADATVYYDGIPSHHTNDFFILMKDNGVWKILSGSYTSQPLTKDN